VKNNTIHIYGAKENVESVYVTNGLLKVSCKNEWFTVKSSNDLFKMLTGMNLVYRFLLVYMLN